MADPLFASKDIKVFDLQNLPIDDFDAKLKIVKDWQKGITSGRVHSQKEEQLQYPFLENFFGKILDYPYEKHLTEYMLENEKKAKTDSTKPDGALGYFKLVDGKIEEDVRVVIELKDATVNLDKKQNREDYKGTPVEQAFSYVPKMGGKCKWVIVSNFLEIRLYHHSDISRYESFNILDLEKDNNLLRFCYLLQYGQLFLQRESSTIDRIIEGRQERQKTISNEFYKEYRDVREKLFFDIRKHNPNIDATQLFHATQKLIDRIIFTCFVSDMQIIADVLKKVMDTSEYSYSQNDNRIWTELKYLFTALDKGYASKKIPPFNGGLFIHDEILDELDIRDHRLEDLIDFVNKYDFQSDLNVNILGHIFEQSISDIEEILAHIQANEKGLTSLESRKDIVKTSKRKQEGVFYTPAYITRYIVEETVGTWLEDRRREIFAEMGIDDLTDPGAEDYQSIKFEKSRLVYNETIKLHLEYWARYEKVLHKIKVLDPACGSGAFLTQALDFLYEEWHILKSESEKLSTPWDDVLKNNRREASNSGGLSIQTKAWDEWHYKKQIIVENIFGVDINPASVEITKLSLWLKTANRNESLASLEDNIRLGNSLINDPEVGGEFAFDWKEEFQGIMEQGGFDVVVGNPPYVRQELFGPIKNYLSEHYTVYNGTTDLFAYFYEQSIHVLQFKGYLGFISNTFEKTASGILLRKFLTDNSCFSRYVDLTDKNIFEGATTYPIILITRKDQTHVPDSSFQFIKVPGDIADSEININTLPFTGVAQSTMDEASWTFYSETENLVLTKIKKFSSLSEKYEKSFRGILTGLKEAFIINAGEREKIIKANPDDIQLLKPLFEGKDLEKWHTPETDKWLICVPKGFTIKRILPGSASEYVSEPPPRYGYVEYDDAWDWFKRNCKGIAGHLLPFKDKAEARTDKGDYWWELRACDYYQHFESPKIIWPNLQNTNKFSFDDRGYYLINPSVILPVAEKFLLPLLNSKVIWYFLKSICAIRNGGYIEVQRQYVEQIPIPDISAKEAKSLIKKADIMISGHKELHILSEQFMELLEADFKPEKVSGKLNEWYHLEWKTFKSEITKSKPVVGLTGKAEENWHERFHRQKEKAQSILHTLSETGKEIDLVVYSLYGLTPEEIKIVEKG